MTSNPESRQIIELVHEVLQRIPEPYSESVPDTNTIFWYIYRDENLLHRYRMISQHSVNSRIGRQIAIQTGQTEVSRSSRNKCPLIVSKTYALLRPTA